MIICAVQLKYSVGSFFWFRFGHRLADPLDAERVKERTASRQNRDRTRGRMEDNATQAYGEVEYWNNRYGRERHPFDWYQKYPSLAPLINLYLPLRHSRVLVVGCGNSGLSSHTFTYWISLLLPFIIDF